jgi:putative uncharacterized protein (fragment)
MNKGLKTLVSLLLVSCTVCVVSACGGEESAKKEISIEAKAAQVDILKNQSTTPEITVTEDGKPVTENISIVSDNACVVVENGKLKGVSHGNAEITVSYKTKSEKFGVTVYDAFIDSEEDWWDLYNDLSGWYKLTTDITLSESTIDHFDTGTGNGHTVNKYFEGYLNGGENEITYKFARLFSKVRNGAVIENLKLTATEGFYWGAAIAFELNASTVRNVSVNADFLYKDCWIVMDDGTSWIQAQGNGSLFYYVAEGSLIENCDVIMDVSAVEGIRKFGAVAYLVENSTVKNCKAEVTTRASEITKVPGVGSETNSTIENVTVSYKSAEEAEYTVEYYLETEDGYVKDETNSEKLTGAIGKKMFLERKSITGYVFDEANENNVVEGIVAKDGSLVLKAYYKKQTVA